MAGFTLETTIDRPADEVFRLATDLDRVGEWIPQILRTERLDDGPLRVGSRFRETRRMGRREAEAEIEVREHAGPDAGAPPFVHAAGASALGVDCLYRYTFEPRGDATRVRMVCTATPKGLLGRLMAPLLAGAMKKHDGDQLESLKRFVEGAAVARDDEGR